MTEQDRDTLTSYPSYPKAYQAYPPPPHHGRVTQTAAVWALALAVIPIPVGWLVSIGLAINVLVESRDGRGRERGRGMAIAALVVAPLWILAFVATLAFGGFTSSVDRDTAGHVVSRGDASVDALRVGDCLAEVPGTTKAARTVELVPCSSKHAAKVFAAFDLADGAFPGDKEVTRLSEGGCVRRFDDTFGTASSTADMELFFYYPIAATWAQDHEVICIASQGASDA